MKTFRTFKLKGIQHLAMPTMPNYAGLIILDEDGNNYGAWQDEAQFIKAQKKAPTTNGDWNGTSLPYPAAIGRAFPQIAHGEQLARM